MQGSQRNFLMIAVFIYTAAYALDTLKAVISGLIEKHLPSANC